jgi:hypothetical protein
MLLKRFPYTWIHFSEIIRMTKQKFEKTKRLGKSSTFICDVEQMHCITVTGEK